MVERIATIIPIATRNNPFTISEMMPKRMPNIPKELSFKLSYLPLVYPTFFLMRLSVASVVFVSGAQKGRD